MIRRALFCAALLTFSGTGYAEVPSQLIRYLSRPDQARDIDNSFVNEWDLSFGTCRHLAARGKSLTTFGDIRFDGAGNPVQGAWKVFADFSGCGQNHRLTTFFVANKTVKVYPMLPGDTLTDPLLQRDAIGNVLVAAGMIKPAGCNQFRVIDTKFASFGLLSKQALPGRDKRSWNEDWTVRACNRTGIATITFIPDATGTTIKVSPVKLLGGSSP